MKSVKTYEGFLDIFKKKVFNSKEEEICYKYSIKNYKINEDGSIDVDGNVDLSTKTGDIRLWYLPLNFGEVSGKFDISGNSGMLHYYKSIKGCPKYVGGRFNCSDQRLNSLENCPKYVGGNFDCSNNNITSFEFYPEHVGGKFICWGNPIESVWDLISSNDECNKEVIDLLNDYDCIREDGIILERFNEFLMQIGRKPVSDVKGYKIID
jgi:hypothetical protein